MPADWRNDTLSAPVQQLRELRTGVNKVLEDCRSRQELGASLEASVRIDARRPELQAALSWLNEQGDAEVDGLRDWLLVSQLQIGGEPWAELLASQDDELAVIEVSRARGRKCERCWHYEGDVGQHPDHPHICGRCVGVLDRRTHQLA